jgi:WD40 repeat protein
VGSSTGKVDLLRLEATKASGRNNVLSSGPIVPLTVRNSRSCNALAFCTADPNYLAVGLDKVRGDCSLMIWDIQSSLPTLSVDAGGTSVLRPELQIPRVDAGHRADQRVLQQRASTDIVSSLSFVPQSVSLLLAGISYRWLRLFDLRSQAPFAINVALKVHGIVTDPFDAHRIACFGDGIVTVWDTRKLTTAMLTFTEKDASADGAAVRPGSNPAYTTIEFSSIRRGVLATLEKDATYVRFWDILSTQGTPDMEHSKDPSRSSKVPRTSWTNLPWAAGSDEGLPPVSSKESDPQVSGYEVVISDTRKSMFLRFLGVISSQSPQQKSSTVRSPRLHLYLVLRYTPRCPRLW